MHTPSGVSWTTSFQNVDSSVELGVPGKLRAELRITTFNHGTIIGFHPTFMVRELREAETGGHMQRILSRSSASWILKTPGLNFVGSFGGGSS